VTAPLEERETLYRKYELSFSSTDGAKWTRGDGTYPFVALQEVAEQFPETREVYERSQRGPIVATGFQSAGAALVGATLGWNLAASAESEMSTGAQVALYSSGAGLIAIGVILALAWHDPALDFADVYNAELRKRLNLSGSSAQNPEVRSVLVPRLGANGAFWSF
jgi:hypothetical protein